MNEQSSCRIEIGNIANKTSRLFNKNVCVDKEFGVTKALMDRLNYLPELLKNARVVRIDEESGLYGVYSEFPSLAKYQEPTVRIIGLEYCFIAHDQRSADQLLEVYKNEMGKDALKVFLGFWKAANIRGVFNYSADLVEIMEYVAGPGRQSYFSIKEKKRFWVLTKLLEATKLTIRVPIRKRGKIEKTLMIEHRLIEVLSRNLSGDLDVNGSHDNHPNKISVQVLNPREFQERANLATAIANGALCLDPHDVMLALSIHTRASQRRNKEISRFDEDYLMERGHLQKTRSSNPRVARQRLKNKLQRLKDAQIIKNWQADKNGYYSIEYKNPEIEV